MLRLRNALLAAVFAAGVTGTEVLAADQEMLVLAQVGVYCTFDSGGTLSFGPVSAGDTGLEATADLAWTCAEGQDWTLSDDNNYGVADGQYDGTMIAGDYSMPFHLEYTNTVGTSLGTQETSTVTGYLTVPADQAVGNYKATVIFRIEP